MPTVSNINLDEARLELSDLPDMSTTSEQGGHPVPQMAINVFLQCHCGSSDLSDRRTATVLNRRLISNPIRNYLSLNSARVQVVLHHGS